MMYGLARGRMAKNNNNNNWILSVTPAMWRAVEKKGAYATRSASEKAHIKSGDIVIFYILGTGKFNCACKAISGWHEPSAEWPARVTDEMDISVIQTGTASVGRTAPLLLFAKRRRWIGLHLHGGLANYGRPIHDADRDVILGHMRESPRLVP